MHIAGPEQRQCPAEYQDRITRLFGTNQFGDPNFKLVWNQSQFIRMGNMWTDRFGVKRRGYKDVYQGDGQPCWMIMKWYPAAHYGSPATYYDSTFDALSETYHIGEYPWRGRYEIMQPLRSKEMVDGKLVIDHFPLSHYIIDTIIPMMLAYQRLSREEQLAAKQLADQERAKRESEENAERMYANMPTWVHPVSYSNQGCRTSILDQKMYKIQKTWDRLARQGLKPMSSRGVVQAERPVN